MIEYTMSCKKIDWLQVHEILDEAGLSHFSPEDQEKIFTNSDVVSFALEGKTVVGVSRALSDGLSQAAIYNVAVRPEYQHRGVALGMVGRLLNALKGQNVILYTNSPNISFYEKFEFRRSKTAMCYFVGDKDHLQMLEDNGFMLPEGYRFVDEYPPKKVSESR